MTLEILTSESLAPRRHGFFTRKGGASSGVFAGLNCGQGSSDQAEAVEINRTRVADAMGVTPINLVTVHHHRIGFGKSIDSVIDGMVLPLFLEQVYTLEVIYK